MDTRDYKSKNCYIKFLSDLDGEDAEKMIGKTIAKIEAAEYMLCITFTDVSSITCGGCRWDGCALGAEYSDV